MKHVIILAIACIVVAGGCTTTETPESTAQKLTLNELTKAPGFTWFVAEMSRFTPNSQFLAPIESAFAAAPGKKICIFVKPTCSCRGTQRLFPQVVKTLLDANVPESRIEIWSMITENDRQPYESSFSISTLPAIYVMENGVVSDSISEASFNERNADSLLARAVTR